jgi:hypothetical protein
MDPYLILANKEDFLWEKRKVLDFYMVGLAFNMDLCETADHLSGKGV